MKISIANYYDADRRTAVAGEDIPLGAVIKISAGAVGVSGSPLRKANIVANADAALLVAGNYGVAFKVSGDPLAVTASTVTADSGKDLGSRIVSIKSGDLMVEVRKGAILEYDPGLLHSSLDPARAGTLPTVGQALGVLGGLFATAAATTSGSGITSPVIARVYNTQGGKVRVELV